MEEIVKKIQIFKRTVVEEPDGFITKISYKTSDGRSFSSKELAEGNEKYIENIERLKKVKQFYHPGCDIADISYDVDWYYAANEEDLEAIKAKIGFYSIPGKHPRYYLYVNTFRDEAHKDCLKVGEWIGLAVDHGGADDRQCVYTLSFLKQEFNDYLSRFVDQ